ncbi:glycoside hydrolase family 28 protein [Flavobacterium sp. UMI-01]|uniref:glycoside hydrolase family 28 protein n=1 Tax=Flavobacterium sp. UMI-01 TaxID=1441053 RepID=UPI001C7D05AE|nr:glycosyl hydrolase family 28-related protein [Flavobacterium sp. UMI-01]GIZ08889.1 hypothetical protein FUMI01_16160 [Flavobacterium sp. UMI-01]
MKFKIRCILFFSLIVASKSTQAQDAGASPWSQMKSIEASIVVPVFKNKSYNVLDYGAIPDGETDNTKVLNKVIWMCSNAGGGRVIVPAGKYLSGPINLQNNVNLHLAEGVEILFSTNPKDYPIVHTSFEGTEVMNFSPLVYAYQKKNVALTGKGVLNGQATNENWWFYSKIGIIVKR